MGDTPQALIDAVREGRALIVCGAGVTRLATDNAAPGWKALIEAGLEAAKPRTGEEPDWVKGCRYDLTLSDVDRWLTAADRIQKELGGHEGGLYSAFLKKTIGSIVATKPDVLDALCTVANSGSRLATTNYDETLSDRRRCKVICWKRTTDLLIA